MIKEYDLEIFSRKLWVGINPTYDEIKENVGILVKEEMYDEFSISDYNDIVDKIKGTTTPVCNKEEPHRKGYLVSIPGNFKKDSMVPELEDFTDGKNIPDLVNTITHECVHVCDLMKKDIGLKVADTETNAYVSGFCAECVTKTILEYKNQKDDGKEYGSDEPQSVAE